MNNEQQQPKTLEELWRLQAELNAKSGQDTATMGDRVRFAETASPEDVRLMAFKSNSETMTDAGRMLNNYLNALADEVQELRNCTSWKHWYKEAKEGRQFALYMAELQNARVEVIDMLFFWISLAQTLGLSPDDVFRLYAKKLGINHNRQDENRTQADVESHVAENKTVV